MSTRQSHDTRRSELAMIHIAKAAIGMAEDVYRDMLWTHGQVLSAADLDRIGRKRVLDHLKACGWKPTPARKAKSRKLANEPQLCMIRGLWIELHQCGIVRDSSEAALIAFVRRYAKVDALEWLNGAQTSRIIEHLKKWRNRAC